MFLTLSIPTLLLLAHPLRRLLFRYPRRGAELGTEEAKAAAAEVTEAARAGRRQW